MRVAFQHFGSDSWLAGNAFIENMFLALRTQGPNCPGLVLIVDQNAPEPDIRVLAAGADQVLRGQMRPPDQIPLRQWSLHHHLASWLRTRVLKAPARVALH